MLTKVNKFFAEFAPIELAEGWDNVGVLVENPRPNGSGVIGVTIDLTPAVLEELLAVGGGGGGAASSAAGVGPAEVIIAYHPPIFSGLKKFRLSDAKQKIVLDAVVAGASIYSPHTCVDSCRNSINDWLVEACVDGNRKLVKALAPITVDAGYNAKVAAGAAPTTGGNTEKTPTSGDAAADDVFANVAIGAGRIASFAPESNLSIELIVANLKKHLDVPTARVSLPHGWTKDKIISGVAVCAGSGAGLFKSLPRNSSSSSSDNNSNSIELLISGEMGHHDVLAANDQGRAVVLFEHTNSERGYLKNKLVPALKAALGEDVKIVLSSADKDPLVVW